MNNARLLPLLLTLLLAACASQPEATPTATLSPTPLPTATATPETLPTILKELEPRLKGMGFELAEAGSQWELRDADNQLVLSASDVNSLTLYGAEGETFTQPAQAFSIQRTIGAGMEQLLVLGNTQGETTHTYLPRGGYWAELVEIQPEARVIADYPVVPIEALWSGLLAQTEALNAQPFPEGTVVPNGFGYRIRAGAEVYWVMLHEWTGDRWDISFNYLRSWSHPDDYIVDSSNDYRRFTNFYRSQTPEGTEILMATEQVLMTDGKTSLFLHYVYGPEWPWDEDARYAGHPVNLIDDVFLARIVPPKAGRQESWVMRPTIFTARWDGEPVRHGGILGWGTAITELYALPQNNPVAILDGLEESFREQGTRENASDWHWLGEFVSIAGDEINELQYIGLDSDVIQSLWPQYFVSP